MGKCKGTRKFALGGTVYDNTGFSEEGKQKLLSSFNQRFADPVAPAAPAVQQAQKQADNPLQALDNKIAMGNALAGLSNTERYQLQNPGNAPYKVGKNGIVPGSAAEVSMMRQQTSAMQSLRNNMAEQIKPKDDSPWIGSGGSGDPLNSTWKSAFSGGGKVDAAEEVLARMKREYGAPTQEPVQQAISQPSPVAPRPDNQGMLGRTIGLLKGRQAQIDKAVGYANGGKIRGPGTSTSDSIPAKVADTGEDILVSNGERIVSAAQEHVLQKIAQGMGFKTLDALLEHGTGKPVGPTVKGGKSFRFGGKVDEENLSPMETYNVKPLNFSATPEQKAEFASKVSEFTQGGNKAPAAPQPAAAPISTIEPGAQERTFKAPATPPAAPVAPTQSIAGTLTGGGRTLSLPATPSAAEGYVDAAGNPVSKWTDTARYAEAMQVNDRMSKLANQMQRNRLERDATDPTITNPRVQALAWMGLDRMDKNEAVKSGLQTADLDRRAKEQALATGAYDLAGKKRIDDLVKSYQAAKTPEEREVINNLYSMLTTKGQDDWTAIHAAGGTDPTDPLGTRRLPDQVIKLSKRTGAHEVLGPGAATSSVPKFASPAELEAAKKAGKVKAGDIVSTPNGNIRVK